MIGGDASQIAADIRVATARATAALGSSASWATVSATPVTPCAGGQSTSVCIQVTVTYPYSAHPPIPILPGLGLVVPSTISSVYQVQLQ
jgi:hypothetical protein